ncbi:response regulator transcription factor [Streptomyces albidoflavus]|uniref:response regulator transcription factor n=1 Tax=Streptomyces albidoflavus TaxID=1886 RepID=UPI0033F5DBFA
MTVVQVSVGPSHHSDGPTTHHLRSLPRRPADPRYTVTRRQLDILRLIANGNTTTAIARRLGISYNTVTSQVASIHRKLRVSDRAQAVAVALRMGLLDMDDVVVPDGANSSYRTVGEGAA